ncbi:hypothetical protein AB0N73_10970 [Microbacterium sp. NPDC089189]|uniref:hypothetical protein n=1 Tax=Microbacterium sp. NPDC089189 TaxID=3154972 RepID=UPI003436B6A9
MSENNESHRTSARQSVIAVLLLVAACAAAAALAAFLTQSVVLVVVVTAVVAIIGGLWIRRTHRGIQAPYTSTPDRRVEGGYGPLGQPGASGIGAAGRDGGRG